MVMLVAAVSLPCELPCSDIAATSHGLNLALAANQGDGRETKDAFA